MLSTNTFIKPTNMKIIFAILSLKFLLIQACSTEQEISAEDLQYCDVNQACPLDENQNVHQSFYSASDNERVSNEETTRDGCFRAAVLEFNRLDLKDCQSSAKINLDIFERSARVASNNGAQMIVFPEDGIYIGNTTFIEPCLENIPDPEQLATNDRNPCLEPNLFESNYIIRRLSCIARDNNIYVIANYGTKQSCDPKQNTLEEKVCPEEGFIPLNTDVVIDPKGNFIRRYRKYNPFIEVFKKAPKLEHTYFDTPFGRFGLFTCFDIIYKKPAIELVEQYYIDTAIFPTWWYDELPILSALQFQDGWSWTNGVNFLAANILRPALGSTGSAIFSGLDSVYVGTTNNESKLIIANVHANRYHRASSSCRGGFNPVILSIDHDHPLNETYVHKNFELNDNDSHYIFKKLSDEQTICSGRVCCSINYELSQETPSELVGKLVVIVRDDRRQGVFKWHEQVCTLATIKQAANTNELEQKRLIYDTEAIVSFKKLSLSATFNTKYVFPFGAHNVSNLLRREQREFSCNQLGTDSKANEDEQFNCRLELAPNEQNKEFHIYSFGMYGRLYRSDFNSED